MKIILENYITEAPRSKKQIENAKYYEKKKTEQVSGARGNFADHVQHLQNIVHEHQVVQSVKSTMFPV